MRTLLGMVLGVALSVPSAHTLSIIKDSEPLAWIEADGGVRIAEGRAPDALRVCMETLAKPPEMTSIPWHGDQCLFYDRGHPPIVDACANAVSWGVHKR